jgi:hypothetical protein
MPKATLTFCRRRHSDRWHWKKWHLDGVTFGQLTFGRVTFGRLTFSRLTFSRLTFSRLTFHRRTWKLCSVYLLHALFLRNWRNVLAAWHSGHRIRLQNSRSRIWIPPWCKVFRSLHIAVLLSKLNMHCHRVYLRNINTRIKFNRSKKKLKED